MRVFRHLAFGWMLVLLALHGSRLVAAEPDPLRAAIQDLIGTYGGRYPRGRDFLDRLDRLQRQDQPGSPAELEQLRREALIANPLVSGAPLLFVVRQQYRPDHHNTATFFPAADREHNDGAFTPGSALRILDLAAGGGVRTLLEVPQGVVRDPDVRFDGTRILVSMRTNAADSYHVYEVDAETGTVQPLTFARDVDDLDPVYLPDGTVAFSSTREPKYCMCNRHIMANLFRMEADGANIHQIGKSTLFEGHASLLPDGRLLYDRWEYVDRNFGDAQALWSVNPDGTAHSLYWGNNTAAPGAVIDARAVPGTEMVLGVFGSCHDRPWGALALIDRRLGMDGPEPVVRIWPADARKLIRQTGWELFDAFTAVKLKYEDPYPLGPKHYLASRMIGQGEQMGIYLLDAFGNEVLLHTEAPGCFDPMPLAPRPRPPVIPTRRDYANQPGTFYIQDVYQGTHLRGVQRGTIKTLRVVETPEKRFWTRPPWGGQGQEAPAMNWHDFNNKRILGTVPVAEDGSVAFQVPSERFVYFQLLDAAGMMVQSMRSGTLVQSGERASCVGCHEDRRAAPPPQAPARGVKPSPLAPWHGPEREFSYRAEVQPVFDRLCVRCHDFGTEAGRVLNLAPDRDLTFNTSYIELWRKKYLHVAGAGPADTQPAYSWGSHASRLISFLRSNARCGGELNAEDWDRLVTWIDLNGPYYPSYASAHPDHLAGRAPLDEARMARLETLTAIPLRQLASHSANRGPQVSFDRPELSPCLNVFTNRADPRYSEALALIRTGKELLGARPDADAPGFEPSTTDQWRDAKYLARQQREWRHREALRTGGKSYERDLPPIP